MIITVDMIISGFVSKAVNDCGDILKNRIKDADKNRKSNEKNTETRIYQVIVDALNGFSYNDYKKEEKVYDAAEVMLKQFKDDRNDYKEAVRKGLKIVVSKVTDDICKSFLGVLCYEICQEENRDLAIEVIFLQQEQTSGYIQEGFRRSHLNYEEINRKLDYLIKELIDKKVHEERYISEVPIINRADEYAQKWNENVFLNDFNTEDENAGTEIKLSEIYKEKCLLRYIWKTNTNPSDKLSDLLTKYVINKNGKKMLLILGQPGIGKSTLITWIMVNLVEKKDDILVYQLANDLGSIRWQGENVLNEIFKAIGLEYDELENKTLILDGFDEVYVGGDRERILNKLDQELKRRNILKKFSLIITCRENYVNKLKLGGTEYITLQTWSEGQIRSFCEIYEEVIISKNSESRVNKNSEIKINKIIQKKDIMGIPLILYMVLALNVDIEKSSSMVEIYDQIFSLERGSIYERCYDVEHRINSPEIKKHIHRISQRIAFWMFENNTDKATISQVKFEEICNNEMSEFRDRVEEIQTDTLIGNFFKLKHCDGKGTGELQFVHRSIYEYFVVICFFESIHKLKSKEEVAGKLGELLKNGQLSEQLLEFIKYKFDTMQGYSLSDITKKVLNVMLRDGMTYYYIKEQKEPFLDMLVREMNIFSNMLEIVHLWNPKLEKSNKNIVLYLQHNHLSMLNLSGADLSRADLRRANLNGANLSEADLSRADLRGTDLSGANLSGADLSGTNLSEANLSGADLSRADLRRANLSEADLRRADLREANLKSANLSEANLSGANLRRADLSGTNLGEANLREANLSEANLSRASLSRADLRRSNLIRAFLTQAYLVQANLRRADLVEADLIETVLFEADLSATLFNDEQVNILYENYDLSKSRVLVSKEDEIISYQEYCIRKQKG